MRILCFLTLLVSAAIGVSQAWAAATVDGAAIRELRRDVVTRRAQCEIKKCSQLAKFQQLEKTLGALEKMALRIVDLETENESLRNQISAGKPVARSVAGQCLRKTLAEKFKRQIGLQDRGGISYNRVPQGTDGVCWFNGRKQRDASLTLCEFPLAIRQFTRMGQDSDLEVEYLFSLNGCDLVAVNYTETEKGQKRETHVAYNDCIKQWNQRVGDATMTKVQVRQMEDTIGFCFRHFLLPPQESVGGRENPTVVQPPPK